jgi:GT2 family glycosyltransferase
VRVRGRLWHLFAWRVIPYSAIRRLYDTMARYSEREVGFVSGACLLVRADLFREIGGYDPMYFLTVEDVCDLCERIRQRGYKTLFTPRAQIVHLCGRSGAQVPYLSTLEGYKGDIYHFFKHGGRLRGYTAYGIVVFACAVKTAASFLKATLRRRSEDRQNLRVYCSILPRLVADGPRIAYSVER